LASPKIKDYERLKLCGYGMNSMLGTGEYIFLWLPDMLGYHLGNPPTSILLLDVASGKFMAKLPAAKYAADRESCAQYLRVRQVSGSSQLDQSRTEKAQKYHGRHALVCAQLGLWNLFNSAVV
jgi:hypothetical protein